MARSHTYYLVGGLLPAPAFAAATDAVGSGQVMQVFIGLGVVLALIGAASWAARRMQSWRPRGQGHIRVIEGLALGTREKLVLVEVGDQRILIGMSAGGMQALGSFAIPREPGSFSVALAANRAGESS